MALTGTRLQVGDALWRRLLTRLAPLAGVAPPEEPAPAADDWLMGPDPAGAPPAPAGAERVGFRRPAGGDSAGPAHAGAGERVQGMREPAVAGVA